jgi:hypothetical protein
MNIRDKMVLPKAVDAHVSVNGRGPRPKAVGGIAPKERSFWKYHLIPNKPLYA